MIQKMCRKWHYTGSDQAKNVLLILVISKQ
jgi:hypothetical protein